VRNWEQKRRRPEGPALVLLKVIDRNPRAVMAALEEKKPKRRTA
jgi:putative transcriptional regulator